MCLGQSVEKTTNQTVTPPSWLTDAAKSNLNFAGNLQGQGFTPYSGSQVAPFSGQQQSSFGLGNQVAGGVSPFVGQTGNLISNYANAGAGNVNATPIYQNMSPYMNAYVQQALAPQLQMQDQQFAAQNKGFDANATGAGAFGDTGWGLGRTNLTQQQDTARTGLIRGAYTDAFNVAIGAGAQDSANNINAQTTNANLRETALNRQLGGANALFGQGTGATNLINTLGGQQTAQGQAGLNAAYNQWLMSQQYPFQTAGLVNSTLGAAKAGAPINTNTVQSAPDNSGWGILGSIGGAALGSAFGMPGLGAGIGGALGGAAGGSGGGGAPMNLASNYYGNSGGTGGGFGGYYAAGGSPPVGKPSIVGERGPEMFIPTKPGVVIPNEVLRAAMAKRDQSRVAGAPGLARALGIAA